MTGLSSLRPVLCALALTAIFAAPPSGPALAVPLVDGKEAALLTPHKALYDVSLISAKNGSQIINIHGKMYFEWKPSCEGWITNHRFTLDYDYADSPAMTVSSDFSTFEGFDGRSLNFSSRRKKDGEIYEELRGKAEFAEKDNTGSATYSIPDGLTFKLTTGMMFPTTQTVALLKAAKAGDKFFKTTIFDGSDEEGPVEINSFIGKPFKTGDKADIFKRQTSFKPVATGGIDEKLLGPGWNIRMAFFPLKDSEVTSDYELTMAFHDNGIISDMIIEYGDFSVRQKLVALEKVSADTCKN